MAMLAHWDIAEETALIYNGVNPNSEPYPYNCSRQETKPQN